MNTTPEQLRLAADILEKDIPYEFYSNLSDQWVGGVFGPLHYLTTGNQIRLRPTPFPPKPDGMSYHNPDGLTAEQVGDGYRLCVVGENQPDGYEFLIKGTWKEGFNTEMTCERCNPKAAVRVPISTPFPDGSYLKEGQLVRPWKLTREIPGFRPLREDESWHRNDWTEEMLEGGWRPLLNNEAAKQEDEFRQRPSGESPKGYWIVWESEPTYTYTTHARTRRPLPEPPKLVPLGPRDIPPGSAIRQNAKDPGWAQVTTVGYDGLELVGLHGPKFYSFEKLMDGGYQILRPGQTDWRPCSKTA